MHHYSVQGRLIELMLYSIASYFLLICVAISTIIYTNCNYSIWMETTVITLDAFYAHLYMESIDFLWYPTADTCLTHLSKGKMLLGSSDSYQNIQLLNYAFVY